MSPKFTIRQLLAGVMLLVFSFSITPKKFLHDAIANHHDKPAQASAGDEPQVSYAGFTCKCDNLVAESPFTDEPTCFQLLPIAAFSVQQDTTLYHFYASTFFFFSLRGPPACGESLPALAARA